MSRVRRQPSPAVAPCTPATWLPPGSRVGVEEREWRGLGVVPCLVVRGFADEERFVAVPVDQDGRAWLFAMIGAWASWRQADEEARGAELQRAAEAKEQASYATAEKVDLLGKDGER